MEFELNHTYLVNYVTGNIVSSVTILRISEKGFHVRWNNGRDFPSTWELKEKFEKYYDFIEDITELMAEIPELPPFQIPFCDCDYQPLMFPLTTTEFGNCPTCNGTGQLPDTQSTAGFKVCPTCWGAKMVAKTITTRE